MTKIKVKQYPKDNIRDPEALAVQKALQNLGFPVNKVSMGREFIIDVDIVDGDVALDVVDDICRRILVNPITHNYVIAAVDEIWVDGDNTL